MRTGRFLTGFSINAIAARGIAPHGLAKHQSAFLLSHQSEVSESRS
jgi:hypothetical protein